MDPALFYTGLVAELYAPLRGEDPDAEAAAAFVAEAGEPALELGCGDGDPLLDLRRRGLDVEGLDSSADMLARCRERAAAEGLDVTLHHQRMEDLDLAGRYRSIFLAGPTFTLLADDDAARHALSAIRTHLTDDGTALVPLWIPPRTPADQLDRPREAHLEDGSLVRVAAVAEVYDDVARTRRTTLRYERVAPGREAPAAPEVLEREWLLHWYTPDGFAALAREAGLVVESVTGDDGLPVRPGAEGFSVRLRRAV